MCEAWRWQVVLVDDWDEINEEMLDKAWRSWHATSCHLDHQVHPLVSPTSPILASTCRSSSFSLRVLILTALVPPPSRRTPLAGKHFRLLLQGA